mgnify:CR=1 FL=1
MPHLLHIDSAIGDAESRTRKITAAFAETWRDRGSDFTVEYRDLHANPPPHLSERSQHWPERLRNGEMLAPATAALQEQCISELLRADVLVVGAPMYNYNIASTLKAWIDLVHVPGLTAPFDTDSQPLRGRSAVIVTAQGAPLEPVVEDFATGPLRHLLSQPFGMDVQVIGTSRTLADRIPDLGPAEAEAELAAATAEARRLGGSLGG